MSKLRQWLHAKIDEVGTWPDYAIDDSGEYEYQTGPDDLEYFGYLVREAYVSAASAGFVQNPPATLVCRQDALFYLRQVSAWLEQIPDDDDVPKETAITHDGPYSVKEAAAITRISKRKIYDDCSAGRIHHLKNPMRIPKDALDEYNREREREPIKTSDFRHL